MTSDGPGGAPGGSRGRSVAAFAIDGHEPTALVQQLAHRFGGEVPGLAIHRPSLEDIYLELIGHDDEDDA